MGKKPAVKARAKAVVPAPVEEPESAEKLEAKRLWRQRKEASAWVQAQLVFIREEAAAAKTRNEDWLEAAHDFHAVQLYKAQKRLADKTLDDVPQELREALATYLAQFKGEAATVREEFCECRDLWDLLPPEEGVSAYVRQPETPEAAAAIEQVQAWTDASVEGMGALATVLRAFAGSPGVQQAGLTRIGFLLSAAQKDGTSSAEAPHIMPMISEAMQQWLCDPGVQRSGCAALRGLALADGQLPLLRDAGGVQHVVTAVKTHYKIKEVAEAGNGALWTMAKAAGHNSPEVATMVECGAPEALMEVMQYHAWDQTLVGRVRLTLPFIKCD